MKLVYLWVEKFRSIEQQGFSFSTDFDITYNITPGQKRSLIIRRLTNKSTSFGNKITNITALIGENGSGKTNVLDILGFHINDRFQNANQNTCYFILYHVADDEFIIEGSGFEQMGLFHVPERVSNLFSMAVKLVGSGELTFLRLLQGGKDQSLAVYLNLRNQFNKQYWTASAFTMEKDPYYLFFRWAVSYNNTGIFTKYQFIRESISVLNANSSKQIFQVSPETRITITTRYIDTKEAKAELKYDSIKGMDWLDYRKTLQPNTMSAEDRKKHFILELIENTIHDLFRKCVKDYDLDRAQLQYDIDKVRFRKGSPANYLLGVLKVIGGKWDQIIGLNRNFFDCFKEMYDLLRALPETVFRKQAIIIKVHDQENEKISAFLQYLENSKLDNNNSVSGIFDFNITPLSSGEEAFLALFASLHFAINKVSNAENTTCILLLDEPDAFMHPEWSRIMINQIITYLEGTAKGYKDYQIILTTHSPFIISDLSRQNLIALKKERSSGKSLGVSLEKFPETFASNIHTLLSNEFFMEDTIGEFAKQKVTDIINRLINIISEKERLDQEYLNQERIYIQEWIEIMGEPIIKTKLLQLYKKAFPNLRTELRKEKLQRLRAEIKELEKELGDEEL
ncbi:AAA family ATPase [Bacillus cereus]|uniref:AAA family ATPase n=1 Tax=Bacillus cereus TaxID=1396 RepID=UPI001402039A|nr:AAA family ATPase [Bacillus cereus]